MLSILLRLLALAGPTDGDGAAAEDPPWSPCVARVVDGATHVAVAGVEVWWLNPDQLTGEDATTVRERGLVPEEWIRRLGHHAITDAAGDVALPAKHDRRIVVAWHDGKVARCDMSRYGPMLDRSRVAPLELEGDVGQLVRVVDESGAPVRSIAVAAWCEERGICINCGPNNDHVWSAPTDARGEVVLPHADWFFRSGDSRGNLGDRVHLVGLGFPMAKSRWVGREAIRGDPPAIELVAPPLEPLVIDLLLESGERCTRPLSVRLDAGAPKQDRTFARGRPFGSWTANDGRLELPGVARGLSWVVSAYDAATATSWSEVAVSAADPAAPAVRRSARADDHGLRVHGRVVDDAKRPIGDCEFASDWDSTRPERDGDRPSFFDFSGRDRLAHDGRFTIELFPRFPWPGSAPRRRAIRLALHSGTDHFDGFGKAVRVELATDDDVPEIDVGDVVLALPRVVVTGRIVDRAGRPLAGLDLWVAQARAATDLRRSNSRLTETDDVGRFEIAGADFQGAVVVEGCAVGWRVDGVRAPSTGTLQPTSTPIAVGSADVEIVLVPLGGMRGRVLFAEGMRARDVVMSTTPPNRDQIDFYPDGVFEIRGEPRRVSIQCRAKEDDAFLGTSQAVVLPEEGMEDAEELVFELKSATKKR